MAEIFVNLILGKLRDTVLQEIFFLCGVNDKVERVKRELNRLQSFLRDADHKSIGDERVKNWVNELRGVSYWIEDTIDLFIMELDELSGIDPDIQKPSWKEKLKKMFRKLKRKFQKPEKLVITHKFGKEIDKISARIDEISKSGENYGIKNLKSTETDVPMPFKRLIIPDLNDTELVGVEDEKERIIAQLLNGECMRRSVVSIVGPGGLGKTTVAEKAYTSNAVKNQFDVRIWLSISQNFKLIDLLKKMLKVIQPLKDDYKDEGEEYFTIEVNKALLEKKYLVVLDDVWSDDLWLQIKSALPDVKNGSRVLMTSRFYNILKAADPTSEPYNLRFLDEEESIKLLLKIASPNRDDKQGCHTDLSDIARQLAHKCYGLPLALVALGGILSVKPPMRSVWEKVLNTMVWTIDGKKCMDILATSYDDMHATLKTCFMYVACFPEDYKIDAQDLIRLWVAEGFIPQISHQTMEDVADNYLEELAQRSMIQVLERSLHDNSILTFRIHDLFREVAIAKAKENNFLTVCAKGDVEQDFGKARRLAVHNFDNNIEWMKHASPNIRTLLCFNSELPDCSGHRLIKVLYVPKSNMPLDLTYDMGRIKGLSQLRYFKLDNPTSARNQRYLNKLIGSMKFLQTLDIQYSIYHCLIPDCIWHIKTLRHILIPTGPNVSLFGHQQSIDLQNLQTLICGPSVSSKSKNFPNLPNLRRLKIVKWNDISWSTIVAFLHTLKKLFILEIEGDIIPREVLYMEGYPFYQNLTSLSYKGILSGNFRIAIIHITMFPIHLTMLTLETCELCQYDISVLEQLPRLKELKMSSKFGSNLDAYRDRTMKCSRGGFRHLEHLYFSMLSKLEVWEIEMGAMPMLKKLTVLHCPRMLVPLGIQYLTTVRDLNWYLNGKNTVGGPTYSVSIQHLWVLSVRRSHFLKK